ncbi:RNA-directed DNA polymerase, eukaryota, Reverse transcriptase zinc-binding domain protein [Artemisia annua]|uniref:RNA-directed DNA polymerase, eukaryota, Reverse transcriptase zinc-binding domain protein n=1 Tax=Artemisia annua TaxID=35608 RepID=A0A2U1LV82_ARTAN|nr:RNA-directed DNA polymerase, eukaryota, Reverse transcriptase zinc-binding domain protein [Artemisia annua]
MSTNKNLNQYDHSSRSTKHNKIVAAGSKGYQHTTKLPCDHIQTVTSVTNIIRIPKQQPLNSEDKVEGSWVIDIAMREFKECVDANEYRSGLQFTWTQKPRGLDGTLKKIDRIMANLGFLDSFAGAHAIFQPYHVSDHSPAILHIPTMCKFKPRPFKFSNILVQYSRFKQQVQECWGTSVNGFHMFKVVSKLKVLKKPFRSMLFREGNIHEKVTKLRHELDEVQRALDLDPFNVDLRKEEACYINVFNEAVLKEVLATPLMLSQLRFSFLFRELNHWIKAEVISAVWFGFGAHLLRIGDLEVVSRDFFLGDGKMELLRRGVGVYQVVAWRWGVVWWIKGMKEKGGVLWVLAVNGFG